MHGASCLALRAGLGSAAGRSAADAAKTASATSTSRSAPGRPTCGGCVRPLTGSKHWVEYEGTTVVRKVWNGDANLVELDVGGPAGRIEAL